MELLTELKQNFTDEYGLIVHKDKDGGDTAQRTGMLYFALSVLNQRNKSLVWWDHNDDDYFIGFYKALALLEKEPGRLVRNPRPDKWWSDTREFSRDQQSSIVIANTFMNNKQVLRRILWEHVKRFGFYNNSVANGKYKIPDFAMPQHWGFYVRAFQSKPLYPFLLFSDLFLMLDSVIFVAKSYYNPDDVSDDLNHIMALVQAKLVMSTPFSFLARKIYSLFRGRAGENRNELREGNGPQTALDHYFNPELNAPPINILYKPIINNFILN